MPAVPDVARMRRERRQRLVAEMAGSDVDALLLLHGPNVVYASGARLPIWDPGRAGLVRAAALVSGSGECRLLTPAPDGVPDDLPAGLWSPLPVVDTEDGAQVVVRLLRDLECRRVAVDAVTWPLFEALRKAGIAVLDAAPVVVAARRRKTVDEMACIRIAQERTVAASLEVRRRLRPGVTAGELTAVFLDAVADLEGEGISIDPVWQPVPRSRSEGVWTADGAPGFPAPAVAGPGDRWAPAQGVVLEPIEPSSPIWTDVGARWYGYTSDLGDTWLVAAPDPPLRDLARRWHEVVAEILGSIRPGARGSDLTAAARRAADGETPWLPHLYLAHGLGLESAEPPLVGTAEGEAADERLVLEEGMVIVLEPVLWAEGVGGVRAEVIVAVLGDSWVSLCGPTHRWPFVAEPSW